MVLPRLGHTLSAVGEWGSRLPSEGLIDRVQIISLEVTHTEALAKWPPAFPSSLGRSGEPWGTANPYDTGTEGPMPLAAPRRAYQGFLLASPEWGALSPGWEPLGQGVCA